MISLSGKNGLHGNVFHEMDNFIKWMQHIRALHMLYFFRQTSFSGGSGRPI